MSRRAFFFPHPPHPRERPGRVPFHVEADAVSLQGVRRETGVIMADGYHGRNGRGELGTNQDPCVFGAPWGLFHAFCRIDGSSKSNDYVRLRSGQTIRSPLSQLVESDDIIIYGKSTNARRDFEAIWVDSVLVVERTVVLPARSKSTGRRRRFRCRWGEAGLPSASSDAYRVTLKDAEPAGNHPTTGYDPHLAIVGRTCRSPEALRNFDTSFVPFAEARDGRTPWGVVTVGKDDISGWGQVRRAVGAAMWPKTRPVPGSGRIAEIPLSVAEAILRGVLSRAGHGQSGLAGCVVVPPVGLPSALSIAGARRCRARRC